MTQNSNNNLADSLDVPWTPGAYAIWGQVGIQLAKVALVKGIGQVPYDPNVHKGAVTGITLTICPVTGCNNDKAFERKLIRESSEWGLIQASIQALGLTKSIEIHNKWVKIEFTPTGETYQKTNDQTGVIETKNKTYTKFVTLFANEAACIADFNTNGNSGAQPAAQPTAVPAPAANNDRATALAFLRPIVENACHGQKDLTVILATIEANLAGMPLVNKFFTKNSPETLTLVNEFMVK